MLLNTILRQRLRKQLDRIRDPTVCSAGGIPSSKCRHKPQELERAFYCRLLLSSNGAIATVTCIFFMKTKDKLTKMLGLEILSLSSSSSSSSHSPHLAEVSQIFSSSMFQTKCFKHFPRYYTCYLPHQSHSPSATDSKL